MLIAINYQFKSKLQSGELLYFHNCSDNNDSILSSKFILYLPYLAKQV